MMSEGSVALFRELSPTERVAWLRALVTHQREAIALSDFLELYNEYPIAKDVAREVLWMPDQRNFELLFAPQVPGVPALAGLMVDPPQDFFVLLSFGLLGDPEIGGSPLLLTRLVRLAELGYRPSDPVACIAAFARWPACFEWLLWNLGHHIVPQRPMRYYKNVQQRYACTCLTQGQWLRKCASDGLSTESQDAALRFLAVMARAAYLKALACTLAKRTNTVMGRSLAQVLKYSDWGPVALQTWSSVASAREPAAGALAAVASLEDVGSFCTSNQKKRRFLNETLFC